MKKFIFISLLVITQYGLSGYIKAADEGTQQIDEAADPNESWNQAVQNIPNWQQRAVLNLVSKQIDALPANFNPPKLELLNLNRNQLGALPANFNPSQLRRLCLNHNRFAAIPDDLELHELMLLDLSDNDIQKFNPARLLMQFPKLVRIVLSNNPLDPANIQDLRDAAIAARRPLDIDANDILPPRPEGDDIKGSEE